jgi:hypothetical protein
MYIYNHFKKVKKIAKVADITHLEPSIMKVAQKSDKHIIDAFNKIKIGGTIKDKISSDTVTAKKKYLKFISLNL